MDKVNSGIVLLAVVTLNIVQGTLTGQKNGHLRILW